MPDKARLQRTYSNEGLNMYTLSDKDFKTNSEEEACPKQGFIGKGPLEKAITQDPNPRVENDREEIPLTDDVSVTSDENGRRRTRENPKVINSYFSHRVLVMETQQARP